MTEQEILKWWNAWRFHSNVFCIGSLFHTGSLRIWSWLRSGLSTHQFVDGLATCEKQGHSYGIHPLGFAQWQVERLARGAVDVPKAITRIQTVWPNTWATVSAVDPELYQGEWRPEFSWKIVARDRTLLSCALAILWKASGFDYGGPFVLGAEMPGTFALKHLVALTVRKSGGAK